MSLMTGVLPMGMGLAQARGFEAVLYVTPSEIGDWRQHQARLIVVDSVNHSTEGSSCSGTHPLGEVGDEPAPFRSDGARGISREIDLKRTSRTSNKG